MKNIVIATFNYYPTRSAGTERYVLELTQYLIDNCINPIIVCAVNGEELKSFELEFEKEISNSTIEVYSWTWNRVKVYGVDFLKFDRRANGCLYSPSDAKSLSVLASLIKRPHELWLHGGNRASNLSIIEAFSSVPYRVWIHTPFGCPKGDLMMSPGIECNQQVKFSQCAPCILGRDMADSESVSKSFQSAVLSLWRGPNFKKLLSNALRIYTFTPELIPHLEKNNSTQTPITVVQHGCDTSTTPKMPRNKPIRFGFLGRFEREKGFDFLVKFWSLIQSKPGQRSLTLVGKTDAIELKHGDFLNRSDVSVCPPVSPEHISMVYDKIDVLLVPSKFFETGPLVVHEAVNRGCLVLASNHGGLKSLGKHYGEQVVNLSYPDEKEWACHVENLTVNEIERVTSSAQSAMNTSSHFEALFQDDDSPISKFHL